LERNFIYNAIVASIYDGDTIRVDIDLGFGIWKMNQSLRLIGIDAPEVRGVERPLGLASKEYLIKAIPVGSSIVIETQKDRTEKYGRYLATIYLGERNLNKELLELGFATKY
jgi:micrococcal nuclease